MVSKKNQFKKILHQYDQKRIQAQNKLDKRKLHVYQLSPEIQKIDQSLAHTGIKITRLIIHQPGDRDRLIEDLKQQNKLLVARKEELLGELGFKPSYLELSHDCDTCKDTGYIDDKPCNCLKQQLIDYAYDQSNIKKTLLQENFTNYNLDFYSDEQNKLENRSPRENMRFILRRVKQFIDHFPQHTENYLFYGDTGLGKTYLCNCIAKAILDKGCTVLYFTAFELFHILERYKFSRKDNDELLEDFHSILNCDLLIIDDLGSEFNTQFTSAELFNCINTRILDKKATIISTNQPPSEIKDRYSDRIASRVMGNYALFKFFGKDIRIQRKFKEKN